ncbi:MAG: CD225/dispanin family protein [Fimbriimonadaceae bacterium]|nr:CD225/dispanin family protein [Fimbriimonadaceae bacterium]
MRYYVIGADGKRYGPVDMGQLQQWVGEGRVTRTTMVVEEASGVQYAANVVQGLHFSQPTAQQQPQQSQQGGQYYHRPGYTSPMSGAPQYSGPVPNTGLSIGLAIFTMLCCGCMPLGIVSLVYAVQANSAVSQGNIAEANRLDATSRTWAYWSIGVGVVSGIFYAMAMFAGGMM